MTRTGRWLGRACAALLALSTAPALAAGTRFVGTPIGPSRASLGSISCPSAQSCFAVGGRAGGPRHTGVPLAERWNGSAWKVVSSPAIANATPLGVSCASTASCMMVGVRGSGAANLPFTERWNGRAWRLVKLAALPGFDNQLYAVSCRSASSCVAVGGTQVQSAAQAALVERWNGRRWSAQRIGAARKGVLRGVSCSSSGNCWAAGLIALSPRSQAPLIVHITGGRARVVHVPERSGILGPISCPSARTCWATGQARSPFLLGLANGKWHAAAGADRFGEILGIDCVSGQQCTAVGADDARGLAPWAGDWDGSSWTKDETQATSGGQFGSVACPDAGDCFAVGYAGTRLLAARSQPQIPAG